MGEMKEQQESLLFLKKMKMDKEVGEAVVVEEQSVAEAQSAAQEQSGGKAQTQQEPSGRKAQMQQGQEQESIYGDNLPAMQEVMDYLMGELTKLREQMKAQYGGSDPVEHCLARIKTEESMREKCRRQNLPETTQSALEKIHDAIGLRVVCAFVSDVYAVRDYLEKLPDCKVVEEKDYIRHAKPNGYRSLHLILRVRDKYYAEIQIRTISMDTWAALEHNMRYKKNINGSNTALVATELKRCADELASTDMSMQTIRDMIYEDNKAQ